MDTDINSLTVIERLTLFSLYYVCNGSIYKHVPEGAVSRGFASNEKGDISKALKKLVKKGLCKIQPTGRNTTYCLTIKGSKLAKDLLDKYD